MSISLNNVNSEVVRAHQRIDLLDFKTITNVSGVTWAARGNYKLTTPLNPKYNFITVVVGEKIGTFRQYLRIPYKYKSKQFAASSHDEYSAYYFVDDNTFRVDDYIQTGERQGVVLEIFQSNV